MAKRDLWELQSMQTAPLSVKVALTKDRIREWVDWYGEDGVYVAFSGGKDSTVLLTIVRELYPSIPAVYFDTGLEYPEIRSFVKTFDNVECLKPKMNFKQVIEKYGYPFISKRISDSIDLARKEMSKKGLTVEDLDKVPINTVTERTAMLAGRYDEWLAERRGIKGINYCERDMSRYKFLLKAPFKISGYCCAVMKKSLGASYTKQNKRVPITAQMASESSLRTQNWLKNGCNGFDMKHPMSNPMSFWTEQDVLLYIYQNGIKIASVYGDVVKDSVCGGVKSKGSLVLRI